MMTRWPYCIHNHNGHIHSPSWISRCHIIIWSRNSYSPNVLCCCFCQFNILWNGKNETKILRPYIAIATSAQYLSRLHLKIHSTKNENPALKNIYSSVYLSSKVCIYSDSQQIATLRLFKQSEQKHDCAIRTLFVSDLSNRNEKKTFLFFPYHCAHIPRPLSRHFNPKKDDDLIFFFTTTTTTNGYIYTFFLQIQ